MNLPRKLHGLPFNYFPFRLTGLARRTACGPFPTSIYVPGKGGNNMTIAEFILEVL
jgi:hypothetical protein